MKYLYSLLLLLCSGIALFGSNIEPKRDPVVSGYVKDAETGETLIGASVYCKEEGKGAASNLYGFFSISLPPGQKIITVSFMGYKTYEKSISLESDLNLNILLEPVSAQLEEVSIVADGTKINLDEPLTGMQRINATMIKEVPALMGEIDPVKVLQLMPGISAASEGSSGFSVRGGNPDQNLIVLDEAIVYNAGHLMGFFSVFNNDALRDVNIYKGDIPARSGGRLASLLDIRMKDGNNGKLSGKGGIGTISSRLTLEGPVLSEKTTFLLAGRRTYADIFLPFAKEEQVRDAGLYFYDLNAKISHTFSDHDRIYLSAYGGRDYFRASDSELAFGNQTATLRWNHLFSSRLFGHLSLIYSNYNYSLGSEAGEADDFEWKSRLQNLAFKADFNYYPNPNHSVSFGVQSITHSILPAHVKGTNENTVFNELRLPKSNARELGIYAENLHQVGARLTLRYGLRVSGFQNVGKGIRHYYDENYEVTGSKEYKMGEVFNSYWGLEPRLGASWLFNPHSSVKAAYTRTFQYMHLASNSRSTTPLDVWFPSSPNVKPQVSDQISLGFYRHVYSNQLEAGVEVFYKELQNSIDFKDYAELLLNEYLEGELRFGSGRAYGLEFSANFDIDGWNGWLSYTISRSTRKIDGVNNNKRYLSPYDHTHDVSLVVTRNISKRLSASANWVYFTGAPVTFPVGRFESGGNIIPIYSDRNAERMPAFHRLDLAVTLRDKNKENRRFSGEWVLSLYNAYGRKNAWSISFIEDDDVPGRTKAMKTYLFSIVPSLTYNFKF